LPPPFQVGGGHGRVGESWAAKLTIGVANREARTRVRAANFVINVSRGVLSGHDAPVQYLGA